jgi:citrate lyase beta subunit
MKQTFAESQLENIATRLENPQSAIRNPQTREPIHVVYGGANLFTAETTGKLGRIALKSLQDYVPTTVDFAEIFNLKSETAETVFERVVEKLGREAVEDFRIDFEDGYGFRDNAEEDTHAISASSELARAFHEKTISPFSGFRVKSFQPETAKRAIRTLDLFLTNLLDKTGGKLPENFVVTLPKVERAEQVSALIELLAEFERQNDLPENLLNIEILIETPEAIVNERGEINLRKLVEAANGRCAAAHFGAYDFTSAFGITAEYQDLKHPLCDFARNWMQIALAPMGIRLSDSVTTLMPVAVHRGENLSETQIQENRVAVHAAWREHFQNVTRSLSNGFYQSWDLHPAQLIPRYVAVYSFFLNSLESSAKRLRGFLDKATKASLTGNQFDDAASANGLLNFFNRGLNCGAIDESEISAKTSLTLAELRSGSFLKIISQKSVKNLQTP